MFAINKTPYCVWEYDLRQRNLELLEGIDPNYFGYVAHTNLEKMNEENKHYAALSIRNTYSHITETFFSLLFAAIQAPDCVIGWLQKYKINQLRSLLKSINSYQKVLNKIDLKYYTWEEISTTINIFNHDNKNEKEEIQNCFGKLWRRISKEFLDKKSSREYNNIKHGFRIRPGGFNLAIGVQDSQGVPASPDKMKSLGGSKFGSTFFMPENINADKKHFRVRRVSINWKPGLLVKKIDLLCLSLQNVLSFLKIVNGVSPENVIFSWPSDLKEFIEPWTKTSGTISINMDTSITKNDIEFFDKNEILKVYETKK